MEECIDAFNRNNVSFFENSEIGADPFVRNLLNFWKKWDATSDEEKQKLLDENSEDNTR